MRLLPVIAVSILALALTLGTAAGADSPFPSTEARPRREVTFASHVAKIIHERCADCHHDGQAAPFNLISHADVRWRAPQILEMIESRAMPPWLAEPGYGEFSNERRLTGEEVSLIRQWVEDGAPEGDPRTAPPTPQWPSGWLGGTPNLVVTMPKAYQLAAEGQDVYRNFVIHVPSDRDRFVRAVEFSPGNRRIVHHAFIKVDEEGQARKLEGADGAAGFTNMYLRARIPGGQFLTWNPGSRPVSSPPGLAWLLRKNSDLVVELHLNRTGKPESIQSSVGFYFTDEQPTNACYTFKLGSYALNFPAGATNELVRDSMVLPVDLDVLAVYPHAHFLGREMRGYAERPDGGRDWLVWIKKWDFNWQGDYRYQRPVHLPKGTTLHLEFTYDNSTNNPVNPNHPPRRVVYGERSSDEMCELGLQVLARNPQELQVLREATAAHQAELVERQYRERVAFNPDDAEALTRLGMILLGKKRPSEAQAQLERAVKVQPDFAQAHFNMGVFLRFNDQPSGARRSFEAALRLDPRFPKAHQQLGFTFAALGNAAEAERNLQKALEIDPTDLQAKEGLSEILQVIQSRQNSK